ncbi:MAG TPA: DUF433 domain-containing protein [Planctomycetaceae bacterium]|nr:DUF433 domain-containing protein [Planctomycetaceae bacterium]
MSELIVNNRIAGTRITVWDVLHYLEGGWTRREIADVFKLGEDRIQAAIDNIDANREYVMQVHREIEERNARGNPPGIEARLVETRARMQAWLDERRKSRATEKQDARVAGGR